jgi:general secretion pathway protein J
MKREKGKGKRENLKIFKLQRSTFNTDERGFTLLELMISIVLLVIIIVILVGAMRLGFRSVDSGEKKIESLERMRASFNIIDSQIQSQIPLTYDEEGVRKYYFTGEKDSLQFATNYSIWGGQKGYVIVTYRVSSEGSGKPVLYASENIVGVEGSRETKLLDAFDNIYFEYFYKDPTAEEGNWVEQWTDSSTIPEKIKVHLITGERDLSIIIPVRIRQSMQTSLEPLDGTEGDEEE